MKNKQIFDVIIKILKLEMIVLSNLQAKEYKSFEKIKRTKEDGCEFWYARELSEVLQYKQWRNFARVIDRAKLAC